MEVLQEGRESKGGGGGRERAWTTIRMVMQLSRAAYLAG